ncbi:MAG TPA: fumarylacetoacetate hydrolase family protein [Acidimicrobiia bacterium]|jgi:2-keto-4-pentenoate hydratase/2-oxohepta-3-ene-1,7-dioic acid hydratase in catechol pathway|nr:fumarylacetoacetate hydrolase family protein [Acidimicrobiia bacterium]
MKIVRVDSEVDDITYGAVEPEGIRLHRGSPFIAWEPTETVVSWEHARLLAPVIPTKIVAVGKNYVDHAAEMDSDVPEQPLIFLKPPTSVVGPLQSVRLPAVSENVHHEAELAVVIGKVTKNVAIEDVGPHILGYTAANDITARDLQRSDGQWSRAKGFDTFCPLGPAIDTELDPQEGLSVICRVNGEIRQSGSTSDMVFGVGEIVSYISHVMTLLPGDVILTGTPDGVGPIEVGDRVEVEIEGIGVLVNPVIAG